MTDIATLVGVNEIRELIVRAISKDRVEELTFRDDFPKPAAVLAQGDVWLADEVEAWFGENTDAVAALFRNGRPGCS
jgi:hypothetical protein